MYLNIYIYIYINIHICIGALWEQSDGVIYLIKEIAPYIPELIFKYLDDMYELLTVVHFQDFYKLHTTILTQVIHVYEYEYMYIYIHIHVYIKREIYGSKYICILI
jgi:hypothetical protein